MPGRRSSLSARYSVGVRTGWQNGSPGARRRWAVASAPMPQIPSMTEPVRVSRRKARHLAVMGQLLDAPRPRSIEEVVRCLGEVQIDPTSAVARTEQIVLFSRLGPRFHVAALERLLWRDRSLFEYWAQSVPTDDL